MSEAAAPDPFGTGLPLDTQVSRPRPGAVLLAADGEIDTLTAARLQAGLTEAVEAARADGSGVVVDLSGVTFLASSGLAVLIGGARRLAESSKRLRLVAASRAVTRGIGRIPCRPRRNPSPFPPRRLGCRPPGRPPGPKERGGA